jgi:hypothetical protein
MTVRPVISPKHSTMEISGNQGTSGTRKARGRPVFGCFRLGQQLIDRLAGEKLAAGPEWLFVAG